MALKLRALEIDIATSGGPFGAKLTFSDGLNIIHAANTRGKSTSLTAVTWALGMEGILSPSNRAVLQAVVTKELEGPDGKRHIVHSSHVLLEIENADGQIITIVRALMGSKTDLVSVFQGALVSSESSPSGREDFYTRLGGSATRERGFQAFLARFIGLTVPLVAKYDGSECPLYLQTIFPLHFVEQKRGWSSLQALTPVQYQIRDVQKRALEFVLGLDVYGLQKRRAELIASRLRIQTRWSSTVLSIQKAASRVNGVARHLESAPSEQGAKKPTYDVIVKALDTWYNLPQYISQLSKQLDKIDAAILPAQETADNAARESLQKLESRLAQERLAVRIALDKTLKTEAEELSIAARLKSLAEDRKRSLDAKRLIDLGSPEEALLNFATCPTCRQGISDSILPHHITGEVMSIPDNIKFIEAQIDAFKAVLPTSNAASLVAQRELGERRSIVAELEASISDLRTSLTGGSSPTLATLRERARLESRHEMAAAVQDELLELYETLATFHDDYIDVKQQIHALPSGELSLSDLESLEDLRKRFREQLVEYGFSSVPVPTIEMSPDNYRPVSGNFELSYQVSASDNIRSIWAYLLSLMELASWNAKSNHLGLLILDEPRQQEIESASLKALLSRAAASRARGQQVIFASSQEHLLDQVRGLEVNVIGSASLHDRLIAPKQRQHSALDVLRSGES